jgi:hypothetical protein
MFYLNRASRYSAPLNGNDRLPLVYGDLTDGTNGIWKLPCIDTANFVYCFAGHAVLTVAGGNSINIYANGVLVNPANYTFNASNNYESEGNIATITFTSDQGNAVVTARGKGKVLTGTTLMENIVDIVNDFLTVENDFTSALYEANYKARASQIFTAQAYKAAGVVDQDCIIWDAIVEMMASFLGSVYLDGDGDLVLDIDDGNISQYGATIIRKSDASLVDAKIRLANIVNQCPAHYAYSYAAGEFKSETNDTAHADIASQGIYGVREPNTPYQFYWCRDLTSVQTIQDIIVAKLKDPIYEIEIECNTLKQIHVDQGDVLIYGPDSLYDADGLHLLNNYWRAISVAPDFSGSKIKFRALQTAFFLTIAYLADGSHLADGSVKAGGNRDMTVY